MSAVLAALAPGPEGREAPRAAFAGFCPDTFHFLGELAHNNRRDWMERQRDRYRFAVREPLVELCRALAGRYVGPVLRGGHGWEVDAEARSGRALTSICKNDYGRSPAPATCASGAMAGRSRPRAHCRRTTRCWPATSWSATSC